MWTARTTLRQMAVLASVLLCMSGAEQAFAGIVADDRPPYTVAVTSLPDRLRPWQTTVGGFYYITSQFYYPLFERAAPGEVLASQFLDMDRTYACDRSMRHFRMCLKSKVTFSDGEFITADDLATSIRGIHDAQNGLPKPTVIVEDPQCVAVALSRPDSAYFDRLTTSACSLLKAKTLEDRVPVGLGDYVLESWSSSELVGLYRGDAATVDFPRFSFRKVQDLEDAVQQEIHDVNVMYWAPNKRTTLASYRAVNHPLLRNYALITSFVDPDMGRLFARCFDVEAFRAEALHIEMTATPGFLPRGVPGWRESSKPRDMSGICDAPNGATPVVYVSHMGLLNATTQPFFERFNRTSRFKVEVRDGSVEGAIALADEAQENVIYLIGFGTYSSQSAFYGDPTAFYTFFAHHGTSQVRASISAALSMSSTQGGSGKEAFYGGMHRILLDSGAVIGLGQHPPTLYFHPSIQGGVLSDAIMGYMRISTVRRENHS